MNNKFSELIYELRKAKKMTQAELADLLGITDKAVSRWENGETFPETSQLVPLASIFNLSVDELLKGTKNKENKTSYETDSVISLLKIDKTKNDSVVFKSTKILLILAAALSVLHFILYTLIIAFQNTLVSSLTGANNESIFIFPVGSFIQNLIFTAFISTISLITIKQSKNEKDKIAINIVSIVVAVAFSSIFNELFLSFTANSINSFNVDYARNFFVLKNCFNYISYLSQFSFLAFFAANIIKIVYKKTNLPLL